MNYYQIQEYRSEIYPALVLDQFFSYTVRKIIRRILIVLALLAFLTSIINIPFFVENIFLFRAVLVLSACLYTIFVLLEAMYRSYYFEKNKVDIRVLQILNGGKKDDDLTTIFLKHELGQYVMYRLGFTQKDIDECIKTKTDIVTKKEFEIIENNDNHISFAEFGFSLAHFDSDLSQLFRIKGISIADFKQTLESVSRIDHTRKESQ